MNTESTKNQSGEFGVNVWWTCPEFVLADGAAARVLAERHGFEADKDLPPASRREEVSRAAYSFQDRRHREERRVTEKAKVTDKYITYGILDLVQTASEEVAYKQGTTVRLDKESGRVEVEGLHAADFEKALVAFTGAVTDDDMRNFFRNVIRMCRGIAKRPTGGIYFIPERYVGVIESAKSFIAELGIGAKLYVERIMNGPAERAIVWEAVQNDIDSKIEDTLNAVSRIEKRASALTDHTQRLQELDEMARIYRDILGAEAKYEEVSEKLKLAEGKVAEKLAELNKGGAVAAPKQAKRRAGGVGNAILAQAEEILIQAGKPLHYREITARLQAAGVEMRGNDAACWLNSWICETFKPGITSRFTRVGRGMYSVV
jgi:hypothetical protein